MKFLDEDITENQYLYGVDADKYAEVQIELCQKKITDARIMLSKLRNMNLRTLEVQARYQAIEKAIRFNENLIEQARGM